MSWLITASVAVAMLMCLFVIPIGLPGLWLIIAIVMGLVLAGSLTWTFGIIAASVALAAELAEFVLLRRLGDRFGGSRTAFWGAIFGGMAGLFVGIPVPVVGPLVTAFLGTFAGAALVTLWETGSFARSTRVGWGVVLARTAAVAFKVSTAVAVIAAVGVALVL